MKLANIDRKILHIFWTTWGISIKLLGKMWLMILLKVTKNLGFTLSLWDRFFKKTWMGEKVITLKSAIDGSSCTTTTLCILIHNHKNTTYINIVIFSFWLLFYILYILFLYIILLLIYSIYMVKHLNYCCMYIWSYEHIILCTYVIIN